MFSRTLRQSDYPKITIVGDNAHEVLEELRNRPGRDIWLFGGGDLFRSLLAESLVDTVEVAVIPVLLGGGVPLLQTPADLTKLTLTGHRVYGSGTVALEYAIEREPGRTVRACTPTVANTPPSPASPNAAD